MAGSNPGPETSRRGSTTMVAVGLAVTVLIMGAGGMFALGVGPLGGSSDAPASTTPAQTTEHGGSSNGGGDPSEQTQRPFTLDIENVEKCGKTCRNVTVSLTNNGANPRENVTVTTSMYAGNDTVWEGEESIGTLDPDASTSRIKHVEVGFVGGAKIKQNDGVVTITTVVRWDGGSATFREQKQVSG